MTMPDPTPDPAVLPDARALATATAQKLMVEHFGPGKSSAIPAAWVIDAMLAFAKEATQPASDAPASGAGFVLVPVEPTPKMVAEGWGLSDLIVDHTTHDWRSEMRTAWSAMLAAAPKPASEAAAGLPTDAQVREAMQDAWDTFCDDAQAIPGDIRRDGRKTFFVAGTWADHTAMELRAIMARAALSTDATASVVDSPMNTSDVVVSETGSDYTQATDATDGATGAGLREALEEARRQLEYLDGRWPTGTTPAIIARIDATLTHPAPSGASGEVKSGGKLGWDEDGMCQDHYRFGCPECALPAITPGADLLEQAARYREALEKIASLDASPVGEC